MRVVSARKGSQKIEISPSIDRVVRIQGCGTNRSSEIMHDGHGLVLIDHFTKYEEAAPYMKASAEETCDHLINVWIARHGCPITFQSDNGEAFVGDLTKELLKRSQVVQAPSTTYHPQTNGLVERDKIVH